MNAAEIRYLYGSPRHRDELLEALRPKTSGILFIPDSLRTTPVETTAEADELLDRMIESMKRDIRPGVAMPKIVVGPAWNAADLPWTQPIADLTPEERDARGWAIIDELDGRLNRERSPEAMALLDTTQPPVSGWPVVYGPHPPAKKKWWGKRWWQRWSRWWAWKLREREYY